ncbi:unnamed protein product [Prorocentrum cordatum]|uniref:Uncharacterized protein n=1 Tax=Prorocentrum cordatum TaxID=2364126 RepID=A0ABN9UJL6_9DINO|nr:unnamed protein product [Polarella glacialis]
MALAFLSEVGPDRPAAPRSRQPRPARCSRDALFVLAWAGCQAVRLLGLQVLQGTSESRPTSSDSTVQRTVVLAGMAFLDKYTGPLGAAALDRALLQILGWARGSAEASSRGRCAHCFWVTRSFLWQLRTVVSKVERSICQLVLLHGSSTFGFQPEFLSSLFTAVTSSGILLCLFVSRDCSARGGPGVSVEQRQRHGADVSDLVGHVSRKGKKAQ